MDFDWDDPKAEANFAKHSVRFDFAVRVFLDLAFVDFDVSREKDSEMRRKAVGEIEGKLYVVVYTRRGGARRIISAADAMRWREKLMMRFRLDPANPIRLSAEDSVRLEALTDAEMEANAASDADNPPLSGEELEHLRTAGQVRKTRSLTGMSQPQFARAYRFSLGRLRDLEQGRTVADSAVLAYLALIQRDPEAVRRALEDAAVLS